MEKKIWHGPDERPIKDKDIIFLYNSLWRIGRYCELKDGIFTNGGYPHPIKVKNIKFWVYLHDIYRKEEALDVAYFILQAIASGGFSDESMDKSSKIALVEIDKILKGDK